MSFSVLEIFTLHYITLHFTFLYYANEGSDDVIDRFTKTVQHSIKNISGNIKAVFLRLGTRMCITKETKWQLSCRCYDNSYAAGPVLITTIIARLHLTQGSSTPNNLMGRVKTMREPCLFRGRPPVPLKKVANGDIWFFTERDWNQGCCHGKNIVGVILFLLWCTFLVRSLKITAPIFLEIFLIQYFIV